MSARDRGAGQSRAMSLLEAVANAIVGYALAVITQMLVFPLFGLPARVSDALAIGAIFTVVSIVRSYTLRRVFEAVRTGRAVRWIPRALELRR